MATSTLLVCDGCGQAASPEHIARRLQRLEWTTRYRPVHIQALLLGAASPGSEEEFLYSPSGECRGEAGRLLEAAGISREGKAAEAVLTEFQRRGLLLAHALECPVDDARAGAAGLATLLKQRLPGVISRVRRSLKPKRVVLISEALSELTGRITEAELGCPVVLEGGKPFALDGKDSTAAAGRLRNTLTVSAIAAAQ